LGPIEIGLVAVGVVLLLCCLALYQVVAQQGRLLLRLEALERSLAERGLLAPEDESPLSGLAVGTVLQDFDLPNLAGGRMTLSQWRGRPLLLIFFDPRCPFSLDLLARLAALPSDAAGGRPMPLILTTGQAEENRRLFATHQVACPVLLQEEREVASFYQVAGTPMAYLVDAQGRTSSPLAAGADAVLALAGPVDAAQQAGSASAPGRGKLITRAPSQSRLKRDGLPAGTPAPAFRLPRLEGGELSLDDYRGRRVLLVFSDPACGPCEELAPRLEQLHRTSHDPTLLMVSRGDLDANRAMVAEHGLTFPVALQRRWEISREYGMFATPIGYLIDQQGTIAADVAVGASAILALVPGEPAKRSDPTPPAHT
jgi:peroxiredoxin